GELGARGVDPFRLVLGDGGRLGRFGAAVGGDGRRHGGLGVGGRAARRAAAFAASPLPRGSSFAGWLHFTFHFVSVHGMVLPPWMTARPRSLSPCAARSVSFSQTSSMTRHRAGTPSPVAADTAMGVLPSGRPSQRAASLRARVFSLPDSLSILVSTISRRTPRSLSQSHRSRAHSSRAP